MTTDRAAFVDQYATTSELALWASEIMATRPADLVIGGGYLHRWFILPRNASANLYLHLMLRDDEDVLHDHPWPNTSLIIAGGYHEHTPQGVMLRLPGDNIERKATDAHALKLFDGKPCISLFFTGAKERDWGFHCPKGWVPWQQFTSGYTDGQSQRGVGCGEP